MAFDRTDFLNVLEESYSAYYDLSKENLPDNLPVAFKADFYKRDESFWLSKKMVTWSNETNEFVYCFSKDYFDRETLDLCIQYALDDGLPRVKPHKEHQYTNIKCLFVADGFDDEAVSEIKHRKYEKKYNHMLWGYSALALSGVNLRSENVYYNPAGRDMKVYFKKLFAAQKKK